MSLVYNRWKEIGGASVWTGDTIKVMLVTSSYVADADHLYVDSGVGAANPLTNECSGTGYSRKTLGSKTVTRDDTNNRSIYLAADLTWTAPNGFTPRAAIVFRDNGGGDTTNDLIAYLNGGNFSPSGIAMNGTDFLIAWATTGILTLT